MIVHAINPGSTSLKLACAQVQSSNNPALPSQLQLDLQRREVALSGPPSENDVDELAQLVLQHTADWPQPDAVVARGGWLGHVAAGTYHVTPEMASFALQPGHEGLGTGLALRVGQQRGVPAFVVDPHSVNELLPQAQLTGIRGVKRAPRFHALNARLVARRSAYEVGKRFQDARLVVAHLGATTSITAFEGGQAIDTSGTGAEGGPIGALQAGPIPMTHLLTWAQEHSSAEIKKQLGTQSGFLGLLGSANLRELEEREVTDLDVQEVTAAFVHQVCKGIGEQCGALSARPDALAITGGITRWEALVDKIEARLAWIAPLLVFPGELELEAMAEGAGRVLLGLEKVHEWHAP